MVEYGEVGSRDVTGLDLPGSGGVVGFDPHTQVPLRKNDSEITLGSLDGLESIKTNEFEYNSTLNGLIKFHDKFELTEESIAETGVVLRNSIIIENEEILENVNIRDYNELIQTENNCDSDGAVSVDKDRNSSDCDDDNIRDDDDSNDHNVHVDDSDAGYENDYDYFDNLESNDNASITETDTPMASISLDIENIDLNNQIINHDINDYYNKNGNNDSNMLISINQAADDNDNDDDNDKESSYNADTRDIQTRIYGYPGLEDLERNDDDYFNAPLSTFDGGVEYENENVSNFHTVLSNSNLRANEISNGDYKNHYYDKNKKNDISNNTKSDDSNGGTTDTGSTI